MPTNKCIYQPFKRSLYSRSRDKSWSHCQCPNRLPQPHNCLLHLEGLCRLPCSQSRVSDLQLSQVRDWYMRKDCVRNKHKKKRKKLQQTKSITKDTPGHTAKIIARQEPADKSTWQIPYLWLGLCHRRQDERF